MEKIVEVEHKVVPTTAPHDSDDSTSCLNREVVCVSVLCVVQTIVKLSNCTFFTMCLCCYTECDYVLVLLLKDCDKIINILDQ